MSRHPTHRMQQAALPHVAAIYTRVSSVAQDAADKTSLQTQEVGCRAWAAQHGWDIDETLIFTDRHSGEEWAERPSLTRLRDAARARRCGIVICHSIDRLSRNPVHLGIVLDELARGAVDVVFVTEALDDSPEAGLIRYIKGYASQIENERRRERQMRAVRAKVERGLPISTGRPPFGYAWADASKTRLEPHPATAPVVVRIFTQYAAGASLRGVAAALMHDGVPTATGRGRKTWDAATIKQILTRRSYWGQMHALCTQVVPLRPDERQYYARKSRSIPRPLDQQIVLPAAVAPPLVSPALAAACAQRLRQNQALASCVTAKHPEAALLRGGIARCGVCGGAIHAASTEARTQKNGYTPTRYLCKNSLRVRRDSGAYCQPHAISARVVDAAVWGQLADVLKHPELIAGQVRRMRESDAPNAVDLAAIDVRLASITRRITSLVDTAQYATSADARQHLAGAIDLATKEQRGVESERTALLASAASWESDCARLDALSVALGRVASQVDTWDYAQRRAALLALRARVTLHPPEHEPRVEVSITLPASGQLTLGTTSTQSEVVEGANVPIFAGVDGIDGVNDSV